MSFAQLLKIDFKVGARNYTYPIYLLAAFAYGLIIRVAPSNYYSMIGPLLIFFEPALLGFTFVGTMIFSEKKDGTIGALSTTPIEWRDYYLSKTLIMAIMGILGAFIILVVGTGLAVNYCYILPGAFLTSVVYTLLGVGMATRYKDLDEYFVPLLGVLILSLLPFAAYHGFLSGLWTKILYIIPSYPALYFFQAGFENVGLEIIVISGTALGMWAVIAYRFAKHRFRRYVVEGEE